MSKAAKATEPTFEEALKKLEAIVETMEEGELPLEQLLARYEEGTQLVHLCQHRLSAAEVRLQELAPAGTEPPTDAIATPNDDDLNTIDPDSGLA